ncbi:LysR substrate-binding domain-containing protein [Paracidovorax anthurii]|uniref:LysR family transcriptional regulator n=1 Tax=Paracidovorax anthurii TaxID=78229 RepID=A0A328Z062_9BURK|nr:LysR substrate-binding domain-containing protein [Paracidovorax anthurii]RAR76207.1 LysR family transcriptional regulator [Paracidovorax anthurii]
MQDLNDLGLYAAVVAHGSFSAAARALGLPKSKVSRRIAEMEQRLGVRLLQRSTRAVSVTEVGAAFFKHCEAVTQAAQAAFDVAERATDRPSGRIRVSSPVGVAHMFLAPLLPAFLKAHPGVQVDLDLTSRRVDVIADGYDVALRIRSALDDSDLVVRMLGASPQILAAAPSLLAERGPFDTLASLAGAPGVGPRDANGTAPRWRIQPPGSAWTDVEFTPLLVSDDVHLLHQAALAGSGIAQLPLHVCADDIAEGRLRVLLEDHQLPTHQLHAVYPSRKGVVPAVRAFIDHLAQALPETLAQATRRHGEAAATAVRPG